MPAVAQRRPSLVEGSPFVGYAYGYPHKTAYRAFPEPIPLDRLWADETRERLFLYVHAPFCEYRCGFCNLFTQSNPSDGLTGRYLSALRLHAERVRNAVPAAQFSRLAIGGGTPTYLTESELGELLAIVTDTMGVQLKRVPVSVEASPATLSTKKLRLLRDAGVDRLSLGVQSFDDTTSKRLGRPQTRRDTLRALEAIRAEHFPTLNIDLIYGAEGETVDGWLESVQAALRWAPEELYLYPLYLRPLTGLGRRQAEDVGEWDSHRLSCLRAARDVLLDEGYVQVSLRMFRRAQVFGPSGPIYCCQEDGMLGIGCGARSYTSRVHYSTEFAVGQKGVRSILGSYLNHRPEWFDHARHGIRLTEDDRRRRYAIMSLLQATGLSRSDYRRNFGDDVLEHLPQLCELEAVGLGEISEERLQLTAAGIERSDAIGPWLYSERVRQLMTACELE